MKVKLIYSTPLYVASKAIRTCLASQDKSDSQDSMIGDKDKELIHRVGNKLKHESVKNHVQYCFEIEGISTKNTTCFN